MNDVRCMILRYFINAATIHIYHNILNAERYFFTLIQFGWFLQHLASKADSAIRSTGK